jgi:hypothetical protein
LFFSNPASKEDLPSTFLMNCLKEKQSGSKETKKKNETAKKQTNYKVTPAESRARKSVTFLTDV